jgi:hypothetical protein
VRIGQDWSDYWSIGRDWSDWSDWSKRKDPGNDEVPRVPGQIGDGKGDRTGGAIRDDPGGLRLHSGYPAQGVSPYVAWSAPVSGPTRPEVRVELIPLALRSTLHSARHTVSIELSRILMLSHVHWQYSICNMM